MNTIHPYSDDLMTWDETTHMYVLTEQALLQNGFDVRARISATKGVDPTLLITNFLEELSYTIYGFIHDHNLANGLQDHLIATIEDLRKIIYRALLAQAAYNIYNGDLSLSTKNEDLDKYIAPKAKMILNTTVPCLGASILYTGRWH